MSPSAYITVRVRKTGKRYVVRYRTGGRYTHVQHAGSFKTMKDARARRDLVSGWLAAGRDPRAELQALESPAPVRSYREWAAAYQSSRVDVSELTARNLESHLKRLVPFFGDRDPHSLTLADHREWIAANSDLKPSSLSGYFGTHRLILDFASVDPNPARDPRIKLPRGRVEEPVPPDARQFVAMIEHMPFRWRLPLVLIEQTAMTVGEVERLEWTDADLDTNRFRLRRSTVKAGIRARARWVQVPDWLMDLIADRPADERTGRVFPGFSESQAWRAMSNACKTAGIPHFHPHDLRHRRTSLWHGQGVPARELAARVGHSKPSMSLDVYSHVIPVDEASRETLEGLLVRSR